MGLFRLKHTSTSARNKFFIFNIRFPEKPGLVAATSHRLLLLSDLAIWNPAQMAGT